MILWDLVPERWRHQAFIAGGYAACPSLATDCDLWVFVDTGLTSLQEARETVLEHIRKQCHITEEDGHRTTDYVGVNVNILKVGYVYTGVNVHVMVVDAPVNAVLEGFDISTHQIALLPNGEVFLGSHWTPITDPPLKLIDTPHTDDRMDKIRRRYQQEGNGKAA